MFLSPDGVRPGPYKRLYDAAGIVLTQAIFSYATAPFIILDLKESLIFWSRTYFYGHIGIILLYSFFHSPYGRGFLINLQKRRVAKFQKGKEPEKKDKICEEQVSQGMLGQNNVSVNTGGPGPLGLPEDVEEDVLQAGKREFSEVDWKKAEGLFLRNRKA